MKLYDCIEHKGNDVRQLDILKRRQFLTNLNDPFLLSESLSIQSIKDLNTYIKNDREENLRRIKYVAAMFCDAGIISLVTFISPFKKKQIVNAVINKEPNIKIDCDVLSADGGTRTTSINGSWIALNLAIKKLVQTKVLKNNPIKYGVSAISCGIIAGNPFVDLDYEEDSSAEADANFVFDSLGNIIEIQCTGEKTVISEKNFTSMYNLAKKSISKIYQIQTNVEG